MYAALVAVAVQQIEGNLIIPFFVMSATARVHPFVTLLALVLFGLLGVLFSIPIVLFIGTLSQVLWVERTTRGP